MDASTPVQSPSTSRYIQARLYSGRAYQGASTDRASDSYSIAATDMIRGADTSNSAETPLYNLNGIREASSARHLRIDSSRNARIASHSLNNESRQVLKQRMLDMNRWVGLAKQTGHEGQTNNLLRSSYRACSEQDIDEYGVGNNIFTEQIQILRGELQYLHTSAWLYSNIRNGR